MSYYRIPDSTWVRSALLARSELKDVNDKKAALFTTADLKFTNTELGGNFCINPLPQFTSSADIKRRGRARNSDGMGRYYSETYDDHYQIVHMRFGVASFNSLAFFISRFYNPGVGALAKTGRAPGTLYRLGQISGNVVSFMSWKLLAVRAIGFAFRVFSGKMMSKFFDLKPAMPLYWNAVQTMVNQLAVNMGIVPRVLGKPPEGHPDFKYEFDKSAMEHMRRNAPGIITESGSIDVFAVANRAQRQARSQLKEAERLFASNSAVNNINSALESLGKKTIDESNRSANYNAYLNRWLNAEGSNVEGSPDKLANSVERAEDIKVETPSMLEFFNAELDDGAAFASFRVNYTGSVSESFSNTVGESEIASRMNSVSSGARNALFSFAGGNVIPGMDAIIEGVTGFLKGGLDGIGLGGIAAALTGGTNIDIPMMWQGSSASLPRSNYTMHLVIPYNNPVMQLQYIYLPLCMILAGALPLSTGRQSYTSPFLLEYYDQGRAQSRLGIIDSISITRGGSTNLGFNFENRAMGIEVNFTIADLSSVMHMPIAMGVGFSALLDGSIAKGFFDDETVFSDYMAVLSSMGVADQIYDFRKLKLALTRQMVHWESWTSPARFMNWLGDTPPGRLMSVFYAGVPI